MVFSFLLVFGASICNSLSLFKVVRYMIKEVDDAKFVHAYGGIYMAMYQFPP
jgi:hypothetical protein